MPHYCRVFIDESLTRYRQGLFRMVRKEVGPEWRVRTYDGAIYMCNFHNAKEIKVKSYTEFNKILDTLNKE